MGGVLVRGLVTEEDAAEMIPVLVGADIVTGEFPLLVDAEDFVGPISSMMLFI